MSDSEIVKNETSKENLSDKVLLVFLASNTLMILGWLSWYSRYGLDFTDEGMYLTWLSDPFAYSASTTQFGFIYHPLFQFFDGNIAAMRRANIFITFALGCLLCGVYLRQLFGDRQLKKWQTLVLASSFATAALVVFDSWLLTPNYNSLSLQAILIASTGLLLSDKTSTPASVCGWVLIGVGGWLAFMARPPAAGALAACALMFLLVAKKCHVRLLLIAIGSAVGLLFISAFLIDGSINAFADRLTDGANRLSILSGHHTFRGVMRFDSISISDRARLIVLLVIIAVLTSTYLLQSRLRGRVGLGIVLCATPFLLITLVVVGVVTRTPWIGGYTGLLLFSIPIAAVIFAGCVKGSDWLAGFSGRRWALALLFVTLPLVCVFSTSRNQWDAGSDAGLFWVLSGFVLLAGVGRALPIFRLLTPLALATQTLIVILFLNGMEMPYRQPERLQDNNYQVEVGRSGSTLMLSEDYGRFIARVTKTAEKAGFLVRTPMIDLSGQSPGVLYALGARSLGLAWTLGGYPGSGVYVISALARVPCDEIAGSWLLFEPTGARKLPDDVLTSFGASLRDYDVAGEWRTAERAGGWGSDEQGSKVTGVQQLLKPNRPHPEAVEACLKQRL